MSVASWDSEPLLGTASLSNRSGSRSGTVAPFADGLEVGVDVVERESGGEHQDLRVVQQLADLLGGPLGPLVLGGHPGLGGLLDQLLADRMDAGVELTDGAGSLGTLTGLLVELGPELVERLHGRPAYGVPRPVVSSCPAAPARRYLAHTRDSGATGRGQLS